MIAMKPKTRRAARKGIALLITMIFLALFACLAVAIASAASSTLVVARNRTESQQAAALAESGLQIVQRSLGGMAVSTGADASVLLAAIAGQLESTFQSSTMFDADDITSDVETVAVPTMTITRPDGRTGQINLMITASGGASDDTTITITSIGAFGGAARTVSCNMTVQRGRSVIMDYGIASKGAVQLTGNARITGAADPAHGNILSATYSTEQAVRMTGNGATSGDVAICNPNGQIVKTGNVHIGGQEVKGAPEPEWPQVDISEFRQYATNVYSGNGNGNLTLSNIRIPPNTNPTFSGNQIIRGVVYIQSPNKVTFSGNCTLIGVVVADEPTVDSLNANSIKFTGNLSASSVENLPADAQYDGLRDLKGSFLLAPGYSAQFTGNFNTVGGCMVASEFKFTGNASGRVKGGVVNLRDSTFQMTGEANLIIDRAGAEANPAGLSAGYKLVCLSGSYTE